MSELTLTAANAAHLEIDLDVAAFEVRVEQDTYDRRPQSFPFSRRNLLIVVLAGETYEEAAIRRAKARYEAKNTVRGPLVVTVTRKRGMGGLGDAPADHRLPVAA